MIRPVVALFILTVVLITSLAGGCSRSGNNVVARVGEEEITDADFETFLNQNPLGYTSAQEEFDGKKMLLDSLIVFTLLVQAGYQKQLDQSPEVVRIMAESRERFLLDALYEAHVGAKLEVSEAELRQIYADLEYQVRVSHIMLTSEDTAKLVFELVKAGENFEQLAHTYSVDPRAKRNRGDMGYFIRGTGPEEFERAVFALEVGEVTPPFRTRYGYHIVKMVDKKPNDLREEYARMRPVLMQQLHQDKRQSVTQLYFDSIAAKYEVTVDSAVADYITHKRNNLYPPKVVERLPKYDFDDDQLDRDEKELILATWDGGEITLIDYLLSVRRWFAPEQRPTFDDYDSLARVVYMMKQQSILAHEAQVEMMEESDVFKHHVRLFERYTVGEFMRHDPVFEGEPPSEEELRDYYDQHREEFLTPAQVHLFEILVSDELLAQQLAREVTTADEFQIRAFQLTERAAMRVKRGDLGYIDEQHFPELYAAAKETPLGTVGGPIRSRGKYSVIWPVRWTDETYQDFLMVKEDIAATLTDEERERAIREWLLERRQSVDINIYDDVIWNMIDKDFYASTGSASSEP